MKLSQAQVAHACNPGYSGSRDQEDQSQLQLKIVRRDPILKKPITKKRLVKWLKV
jgi:hypothetical protein